ncbi:GxxExxY protein [Mariprofundus erugo]|uniref:GxxExxY protein n=1 Tax=Mariprofundus erugo TaxID=2528639 RepID=A0A5R9GRP2_9PROT|nr:GxxExxY protein [Mariprofundus erugo]TLS66947.1 GxxExxY protein [Mariprofundus erugo]
MVKSTDDINKLSRIILDAAMYVHSSLGPGLLESAYEHCLYFELHSRGIACERQLELPIMYRGHRIDAGYRSDLLVGDTIIVELKTTERILPVHEAQLLSYLKLSNKRLGLLINFNAIHLKDGIKRMVNEL